MSCTPLVDHTIIVIGYSFYVYHNLLETETEWTVALNPAHENRQDKNDMKCVFKREEKLHSFIEICIQLTHWKPNARLCGSHPVKRAFICSRPTSCWSVWSLIIEHSTRGSRMRALRQVPRWRTMNRFIVQINFKLFLIMWMNVC